MSTHSTIGYETADGGYIGVYCHFDGNPEYIGPILEKMYHADVVILVSRALQGGGIRCLNEDGEHEVYSDGSITPVTEWPRCDDDYAYCKRLDGSVEWISHSQKTPRRWVMPVNA